MVPAVSCSSAWRPTRAAPSHLHRAPNTAGSRSVSWGLVWNRRGAGHRALGSECAAGAGPMEAACSPRHLEVGGGVREHGVDVRARCRQVGRHLRSVGERGDVQGRDAARPGRRDQPL